MKSGERDSVAPRLRRFGAGAVMTLAGVLGCGANLQVVHEGDLHFERCMALDLDEARMPARRSCWRDWLARFTYGQTRDRIAHAEQRLGALDPGGAGRVDAAGTGEVRPLVESLPAPRHFR